MPDAKEALIQQAVELLRAFSCDEIEEVVDALRYAQIRASQSKSPLLERLAEQVRLREGQQ